MLADRIADFLFKGGNITDEEKEIICFGLERLFETDQMIKRLAQDNNIEFVGYNAMYVLIDSTQIISVQNDDLTFLIETSIADVPATLSNEKSVEFPHSLAWTIEELH